MSTLPPACGRTLAVGTTLLQLCAAARLNLSQIGQIMSRPLVGIGEERSELEKLASRALVRGGGGGGLH